MPYSIKVLQLCIRNPPYPDTDVEVPTFEEYLEKAKGRIELFVDLKGEIAGRQMADDAMRIVREHGTEDDMAFISLKYDRELIFDPVWELMARGRSGVHVCPL